MTDIIFGDDMKKTLRLVMWYLKKKYKDENKVTAERIHEDMLYCGNPVISEIMDLVRDAGERIEEEYQRGITIDFPELILWILYKDTAYLPVFMYILKNLMDKKEELMPFIMKYYKEPEDWYVNAWHRTLEHTQEMKDDSRLANVGGEMSQDEKIFTPPLQRGINKKLTQDIEHQIEQEKKRRLWK